MPTRPRVMDVLANDERLGEGAAIDDEHGDLASMDGVQSCIRLIQPTPLGPTSPVKRPSPCRSREDGAGSGRRNSNRSSTYQPVTTDPFSSSPDPNDQDENLDILGDDDNGSPNNMASAQGTSYRGFDINLPNQLDMDDEVADVDVNDEAEEGLNAAEALRAQVNAEGQQVEQATSSSSGSSSGSGSGSGSSTSGSDGSDGDSPSSGGDVDI
uniref:Uncharacterized protein n=1 Tax=Aegilops tauschii TaxID=37682 RepID=R7W4Q9_AEGTA